MIPRDHAPSDLAPRPEEDPRPSRTELARAATAVTQLGVQLTSLSAADLDRLELSDRLREEIDVCRRLKPKSRGRQHRYIGQLLRAEDHARIRARLDALASLHRIQMQRDKASERWLSRLVEEGVTAIEALIESHPQADRQRLRSLTRSAQQDPAANRTKRARRELLRAIRALRD